MILLAGGFSRRKRGRERRPLGDEVVGAVRLFLIHDWDLSSRFHTSPNCSLRHVRNRTMMEVSSLEEEEGSAKHLSVSFSSSLQVT